jgi:hypothetical protein
MNAQNIISHRLFVAALSHDENEASRKRRSNAAPSSSPNHGQRPRATAAPAPPRAVAQQLLLLSDVMEMQTAQG